MIVLHSSFVGGATSTKQDQTSYTSGAQQSCTCAAGEGASLLTLRFTDNTASKSASLISRKGAVLTMPARHGMAFAPLHGHQHYLGTACAVLKMGGPMHNSRCMCTLESKHLMYMSPATIKHEVHLLTAFIWRLQLSLPAFATMMSTPPSCCTVLVMSCCTCGASQAEQQQQQAQCQDHLVGSSGWEGLDCMVKHDHCGQQLRHGWHALSKAKAAQAYASCHRHAWHKARCKLALRSLHLLAG